MKNIIIIFIIFNTQYGFGQEYFFDTFYQYVDKKFGRSAVHLQNSKDNNYGFNTGINAVNKFGHIYDCKKNISHEHEIKNVNGGVEFTYLYSSDSKPATKIYINTHVFDHQIKTIDSLNTEVTIAAYRNIKKRRIDRKIKVIIQKSSVDNTEYFINYYTHGTFINSDFSFPPGTPTQIEVDYCNGNHYIYDLVTKKSIQTKLVIKNIE